MLNRTRSIGISLAVLSLNGCMLDGITNHDSYTPYNTYENAPNMVYPDSYEALSNRAEPVSSEKVVVPQSYHLSMGNPEASKDVDKSWVNSQSPQAYTIQLVTDNKASRVANVLYKAPKQERSAEIKTSQGSYKGVYGTYPSYEAAAAQLNTLPEEVKQGATITTWSQVQGDLSAN